MDGCDSIGRSRNCGAMLQSYERAGICKSTPRYVA